MVVADQSRLQADSECIARDFFCHHPRYRFLVSHRTIITALEPAPALYLRDRWSIGDGQLHCFFRFKCQSRHRHLCCKVEKISMPPSGLRDMMLMLEMLRAPCFSLLPFPPAPAFMQSASCSMAHKLVAYEQGGRRAVSGLHPGLLWVCGDSCCTGRKS